MYGVLGQTLKCDFQRLAINLLYTLHRMVCLFSVYCGQYFYCCIHSISIYIQTIECKYDVFNFSYFVLYSKSIVFVIQSIWIVHCTCLYLPNQNLLFISISLPLLYRASLPKTINVINYQHLKRHITSLFICQLNSLFAKR